MCLLMDSPWTVAGYHIEVHIRQKVMRILRSNIFPRAECFDACIYASMYDLEAIACRYGTNKNLNAQGL